MWGLYMPTQRLEQQFYEHKSLFKTSKVFWCSSQPHIWGFSFLYSMSLPDASWYLLELESVGCDGWKTPSSFFQGKCSVEDTLEKLQFPGYCTKPCTFIDSVDWWVHWVYVDHHGSLLQLSLFFKRSQQHQQEKPHAMCFCLSCWYCGS